MVILSYLRNVAIYKVLGYIDIFDTEDISLFFYCSESEPYEYALFTWKKMHVLQLL